MAAISAHTNFVNISIVDETIRAKGWNTGVVMELAARLGVSHKTVYKLRARAERWTQGTLRPDDVAKWRMRQVQALEEIWRQARDAQDYKGAAKALEVQARLVGSIAPQNVNVNVSGTVTHEHEAAVAKISQMEPNMLAQLADRPDLLPVEAEFEEIPAQK